MLLLHVRQLHHLYLAYPRRRTHLALDGGNAKLIYTIVRQRMTSDTILLGRTLLCRNFEGMLHVIFQMSLTTIVKTVHLWISIETCAAHRGFSTAAQLHLMNYFMMCAHTTQQSLKNCTCVRRIMNTDGIMDILVMPGCPRTGCPVPIITGCAQLVPAAGWPGAAMALCTPGLLPRLVFRALGNAPSLRGPPPLGG